MGWIVSGLNRHCIVEKRSVFSIISGTASNERIAECPEYTAIAEIDGKGAIRSQPSGVGMKEFVRFRPRRGRLRGGERGDSDGQQKDKNTAQLVARERFSTAICPRRSEKKPHCDMITVVYAPVCIDVEDVRHCRRYTRNNPA